MAENMALPHGRRAQSALSDSKAKCDPAKMDIVDVKFAIVDVELQLGDVESALAAKGNMQTSLDIRLPSDLLSLFSKLYSGESAQIVAKPSF